MKKREKFRFTIILFLKSSENSKINELPPGTQIIGHRPAEIDSSDQPAELPLREARGPLHREIHGQGTHAAGRGCKFSQAGLPRRYLLVRPDSKAGEQGRHNLLLRGQDH